MCRRRPPGLRDVHVGVTAGCRVQETTHHQTCHCPPRPLASPPSWHSYTCRPCFKYTHLQLQTSKLPLRDQLSARASLSCDLWSRGVAHWANLKRWTHLAGVRTVHAQKRARYGSVDFLEKLQYLWKHNTANPIVCLFAYFVQSVCQMQIE